MGPTRWIIDFGMMEKEEAEQFAGAMRHVRQHVYPVRRENRREARARNWWRFAEVAPNLRSAVETALRVIVILALGPHLIVSRQDPATCFDHQLMVLTLPDWYHFGLMQSAHHGLWARARGSTLKGDLRYTNTTIFETFPFPTQADGSYEPRRRPATAAAQALALAAERFSDLRSAACRDREIGLTKLHNEIHAGTPGPVRAAWEVMNDGVDACYGLPAGTWRHPDKLLHELLALNLAWSESNPAQASIDAQE